MRLQNNALERKVIALHPSMLMISAWQKKIIRERVPWLNTVRNYDEHSLTQKPISSLRKIESSKDSNYIISSTELVATPLWILFVMIHSERRPLQQVAWHNFLQLSKPLHPISVSEGAGIHKGHLCVQPFVFQTCLHLNPFSAWTNSEHCWF